MKYYPRKLMYALLVLVAWSVAPVYLAGCARAEGEAAVTDKVKALLKVYEYDAKAPLDAEVVSIRKAGGYEEFHIWYNGASGRVPASLFVPTKKSAAPFPCIIAMHGYGMDKSMGGMFAGQLAPKGYAVISIDAQYHGERRAEGKDMLSTDVASNAASMVQTVGDLRRAVDYLASRGDMDMERIGYVGVSMGSFLGAVFAGVEPRVKSSIFVVGGSDWAKMIESSKVPPYDALRALYAKNGLPYSDYEEKMAAVEPLYFAPLISPRKLLLVNCRGDIYVPNDTTDELFAALPEPKQIEWLTCAGDTKHIPPMDKVTVMVRKRFAETLEK